MNGLELPVTETTLNQLLKDYSDARAEFGEAEIRLLNADYAKDKQEAHLINTGEVVGGNDIARKACLAHLLQPELEDVLNAKAEKICAQVELDRARYAVRIAESIIALQIGVVVNDQ